LRYAGILPNNVRKLVEIEGVWPQRAEIADIMKMPVAERLRQWISDRRRFAGRQPRRYITIDEAFHRMLDENKRLSPAQAFHLTQHGVNQNEDGTFSWKFDNYVRNKAAHDVTIDELEELWSNITCSTLHVYGRESWLIDPETAGRMALFRNAKLAVFDGAGHWVHHDRLDAFIETAKEFLLETTQVQP
jgi:pimeloyl-ACP methyl ester carboxylesterase